MGPYHPSPTVRHAEDVLIRLRRRCRGLWTAALGMLLGGVALFAPHCGWPATACGAAQAIAVWVWVLIRLESLLDLNRRPADNRLLPSLGAANTLTLARAALVALLAGFLFRNSLAHSPPAWLSWVPGLLYLVVVLMDAVDGSVARATGCETQLGTILDTEVDAMGLLVSSLLLVSDGKAPLVFLSVGLGYYAVRLASRLRSWSGRGVEPVKPRPAARMVAGCQMGFAAAALLPVFDPVATFPAAFVMAAAFLLGMATDWLVICGQATSDGRPRRQWLAAVRAAGAGALPYLLRAAAAIGISLFIFEPCHPGRPPFSAVLLFMGLMCTLGLAARIAAVILSVMMAGLLSAGCRGAGAELALTAAVSLIITGAGRHRIWQPEDLFFLKTRL